MDRRATTTQQCVIVEILTPARLASYERSMGTLDGAVRLYEWNMRAAASILELTGMVEVVTRNALDRELRRWAARRSAHGEWFDAAPLDGHGQDDLATARARAARGTRGEVAHGRVVAELTFGFWRYLVGSRYHTSLWVPALHRAFPHGPGDLRKRRAAVERRMGHLHNARNRAAHHEPIHQRDLRRDHSDAIELLGWINPIAAEWATEVASLPAVLDARPSAGGAGSQGARCADAPPGAREHP